MLIALVSVAVATTLLPVVLATVGPRLDWPRRRREDRASRAWTAWARPSSAIAGSPPAPPSVLVVLAAAAFSIQLGNPRAESLAQSGAARAAFESLEDSGIGSGPLAPFEALVRAGDPDAVAETLAGVEGVQAAVAPPDWRRDGAALVTVIPTEDGYSREGRATLDRIRAAAQALPGAVTIGSHAAQSSDFIDAVYGNLPLMVGLIALLTFLLLARAFRSLILPLEAVLLNLLSVAAAWGVMVLVWQNGLGSEAIWGIEATGSINVEAPIGVFAFLFGLSMDYQVFIISRMREAYDRTGSTQTAVVEGIGRTGRLVTSAALILGLAFVALSASPGTEIKIFATALAAGILLDATIVRGVLVPAVVSIVGRWNWWLPRARAAASGQALRPRACMSRSACVRRACPPIAPTRPCRVIDLTGESVSVGILLGDEITLVERRESSHALRYVAGVGDVIAPHESAMGKVVLAHSPPEQRARIVRRAVGDGADLVLAGLADELDETLAAGIGRDEESFAVGLRCVAARSSAAAPATRSARSRSAAPRPASRASSPTGSSPPARANRRSPPFRSRSTRDERDVDRRGAPRACAPARADRTHSNSRLRTPRPLYIERAEARTSSTSTRTSTSTARWATAPGCSVKATRR